MLAIIFNSLLIVLLFTPFGLILSNKNQKDLDYFSTQLLYGIVILSFIALSLNFFFPLNKLLNTLILILPIIFLIKRKGIYFRKEFFLFITFSTIIILFLIYKSNVYRPDAGLYHLPYIKILNEEKIIFGLSNLHFRYAHISIVQYLAAISNNLIFGEVAIVYAQALIASAVIINFSFKIYEYNKNQNYNFHFYYLLSCLIFIIYKMNRYSEYGNDAPSHFLFFFLISEILNHKKDDLKGFLNNFILIAFIIFNKITLLMCLFLGLISIKNLNFKKIFFIKRTYFLLIFTLLWLAKNIIVSGCVLYPVKSLCFQNLIWTDIQKVEYVSKENEAWTKGWPDYVRIKNKNQENISTIEIYLKDFNWVPYWLEVHFQKIINIIAPFILFLIILFFYIFFKKNSLNNFIKNKKYLSLISICFFACIFWIIKVPVFRYGYSYLISLICLLFAYTCIHVDFKNINTKLFNYFLVFLITIFFVKNSLRIIKTDNEYFNQPWPKIYSMKNDNLLTKFKENKINHKIILTPINGYCMYSKKICSQYQLEKKLEVKKVKNYDIFFLKKNN